MKSVSSRYRARGVSLVEIMISLVIGLVVVGAVLLSIIGSNSAGKYQAAYAQMNEDAQIALSIISRDLQMAGYAQPTALSTTGGATTTVSLTNNIFGTTTAVYGCDTGFSSPTANPVATPSLVCGTSTNAAFEVVYEADRSNTIVNGSSLPSDCLGIGIVNGPPYVARNRYYISSGNSGRPELYCSSPVNPSPDTTSAHIQPLIENIEGMKVLYGTSSAASPTQVVHYVTGADINGLTGGGAVAAEWGRVISVRVCLLVRSADAVINSEDSPSYLDCSGSSQTPTDRYLRRAYFTTATLRSAMP